MKHLIITAYIFIIASCRKSEPDAIYVNFVNHAGQDISNVTIDNIAIGTIQDNAETGVIKFNSFSTNSGLPFCTFRGQRNNQSMEGLTQFPGCGNERSLLSNGTYNIEIKVSQLNATDYFDLSFR